MFNLRSKKGLESILFFYQLLYFFHLKHSLSLSYLSDFTRGLFYKLLFEKYFRVFSRICFGKTRSSSSFNHESDLLCKYSRIFSSAESITKLMVQEEGAEQQFSLYK